MYINLKNLITFMYEVEVEDAEEVLHSFLEDAEDLNIRGLSKGNTDGLISNREFSSEPVHKDIEASPRRKRTAERHQKEIFIHDNLSDKKFQCMKCNKIYTHIYRHNKSIHEGVKYPCTECSYKTSYKSNLQQHVAAVHEGVRYPLPMH